MRRKKAKGVDIIYEHPTTSGLAKRKSHRVMELWLSDFKALIAKIIQYEEGAVNKQFSAKPIVGPIYGGGQFVRAIKQLIGCLDLVLQVSVYEDSKVRVLLGQKEIFCSDCPFPCNMCQEELEEAILLHLNI